LGLADICVHEHRLVEANELVRRLQTLRPDGTDVQILRARACLVAREFGKARQMLETIIARVPKAICPRVFLTHVLLQEGRDWPAAEKALRDVLALEPDHAEARSNLEVLLRQQGK
jgi:Flp pilus assembly protein TadD